MTIGLEYSGVLTQKPYQKKVAERIATIAQIVNQIYFELPPEAIESWDSFKCNSTILVNKSLIPSLQQPMPDMVAQLESVIKEQLNPKSFEEQEQKAKADYLTLDNALLTGAQFQFITESTQSKEDYPFLTTVGFVFINLPSDHPLFWVLNGHVVHLSTQQMNVSKFSFISEAEYIARYATIDFRYYNPKLILSLLYFVRFFYIPNLTINLGWGKNDLSEWNEYYQKFDNEEAAFQTVVDAFFEWAIETYEEEKRENYRNTYNHLRAFK